VRRPVALAGLSSARRICANRSISALVLVSGLEKRSELTPPLVDCYGRAMAFHFKSGESIEAGLRRIAADQLDQALASIDEGDRLPHALRKRCKKLRGLLRLVRGGFDAYGIEQRATRDAARALAPAREVSAHLEALRAFEERHRDSRADTDIVAAREHFEARRAALQASGAHDAAIAEAVAILGKQRDRVVHWRLDRDCFAAIEDGLVGTYRSARNALAAARRRPDAERFHELRKHVKYHRHHLDLVLVVWPGPLAAVGEEADALGEVLGEHHDIHVLAAALADTPLAARLADEFARDSAALEARACALAERLLAEKPRRFRARVAAYWRASTS
jgi:CHAD domain-containing protein